MSKKFLQSLTILGLLSTALGVAQPVGAVVSGKYQSALDTYKKEMENLNQEHNIGFSHAFNQISNITDLLDLARRLSNKEEFSHEKYEKAVEILQEVVFKVDGFLLNIKLTKDEITWIKEQKNSSGYNLTPVMKLSKISYKQYNYLRDTLNKALQHFGNSVSLIQIDNSELVTLPLYFNKNINTFRFQGREDNEYYDNFFYDYLYVTLEPKLSSLISSTKNTYINKLKELGGLMSDIEKVIDESGYDAEELSVYYSIALGNRNKDKKIVLSEKLPNIYSVQEKIKDLKAILESFNENKNIQMAENKNTMSLVRSFSPGTSLNSNSVAPVTVTYKPQEASVEQETVAPESEISSQQSQASTTTVAQVIAQEPQAISSEPQEEVIVQSSLEDYTKSQINFWIEDFNTSLNKINYSGIYSEYLESLITRGKQLRNKLDKALGENKSSDDIKRDLDQLEMISNTITSVGNTRNS